jgi:hypothetical protein
MDAGERIEFALAGVARHDEWDAASADERRALVLAADPEAVDPLLSWHVGLIDQLVADDPPDAWRTAQRLSADGLEPADVWQQLVIAYSACAPGADPGQPYDWDDDAYRTLLDRLPFPAIEAVQQVLVDVAAERVVVPTSTLLADALERLGYEVDDDVAADLVEAAYEATMAEDGELAAVVSASDDEGDDTVFVPALVDGVVLTHELSEDERSSDVLVVSFDLAGFERMIDPTLDQLTGGSPAGADAEPGDGDGDAAGAGAGDGAARAGVTLETVHDEPGTLVGWRGPEGWLARFAVGTVLAVRHVGDGHVTVEGLASPPATDEALLSELHSVYDDTAVASQMPVSGEELVLGWLARRRTVLAEPRAPLGTMCDALELVRWRPSAVAHDPEQGVNERMALHLSVVLPGAEDEDMAMSTLAALDVAERLSLGMDVEPERIGWVLDELGDAGRAPVLLTVTNEYFHDDRSPDEADAFTGALLQMATDGDGSAPADGGTAVAVAHHLASVASERAGDLAAAEQHIDQALEAEADFVPALDRLAWYASDRGDAVRAVALWQRCPAPVMVAVDLDVVGPYAELDDDTASDDGDGAGRDHSAAGGAGSGSGTGSGDRQLPPLVDRVPWLFGKAGDFLARGPAEAQRQVFELAEARGYDPDDPSMLRQAHADPLVVDLLLMEGGWLWRFVEERGPLLPDDEAALAREWCDRPRSVYEVQSVDPGRGVRLREARQGTEVEILDDTLAKHLQPGQVLCARAVPAGDGQQVLVGGVVRVDADESDDVVSLLDENDPYAVLTLFGPSS